ncbi:hypothetical protein PIB30_063052 [Stylosanthes scabra]|uniref:O-methyltransferase C-terminal domain-containing protein n=1 Tax=Stylosanthes scabra TaxID=79078 RepID=A0ABU6XMB4_9FABA|nr:hypothetical protein [Stylosanthes scabra]
MLPDLNEPLFPDLNQPLELPERPYQPIFPLVGSLSGEGQRAVDHLISLENLLASVLHDWDNKECLKILKNCHKAIPNDGKVIVADKVLPALPKQSDVAKMAFRSDVFMMIQTSKEMERTQKDFMDLAKASGFSTVRFVCSASTLWVMEFYKQ